eukprot:1623226-Amphidinium_carterae.1
MLVKRERMLVQIVAELFSDTFASLQLLFTAALVLLEELFKHLILVANRVPRSHVVVLLSTETKYAHPPVRKTKLRFAFESGSAF